MESRVFFAAAVSMILAVLGASHALAQSPTSAPSATVLRVDPPADATYNMRLIAWGTWSTGCGILNGPAGQAEVIDGIKGNDADDAGNLYITDSDVSLIRRYNKAKDRFETVAGSVYGRADGPATRARFGGWSYNCTNLMCVSGDGQHLFVQDTLGGSMWRYINLKTGMVSTVGRVVQDSKTLKDDRGRAATNTLMIAKDRDGTIRAFCTDGSEPPDCEGYTKLKCTPANIGYHAIDGRGLDTGRNAFYWHCRRGVYKLDLKTGLFAEITAGGPKRSTGQSGPFEGWNSYCPTGMSISPQGGYVYVGGGDEMLIWRLDMTRKYMTALGWDAKVTQLKFRDTGPDYRGPLHTSCHWPGPSVFSPDGKSAYWGGCLATILLEQATEK